ncbi:MAG: glycogen-binding domain-containing protein, partial [Candidatus Krumholzibacteriia bacterium]
MLSWALGPAARAATQSTPDGIRFSYTNPNADRVFLAGEFNGWNPTATPMVRDGDVFAVTLQLGPGEHEYKFVVDDQWFADPDNPSTVGAYGNSVIRVGAQGELLEMEATSNTTLSPKILLHGRYIGLFVGREDEDNQDRFSVNRPDFNIDLDFNVRVSEALDARALTKIRNVAEETPLWETSMRFDRDHLDLHRKSFSV